MPISLYYFGFVSVLSIVANILLIPFLSFIILPSLFLGLLFPPIWKITHISISLLLSITQKHNLPLLIISSIKPDIEILIITYLFLTITFIFIITLKHKQKYILAGSSFFLAIFIFFGNIYYKTHLMKQDILIYEGPIWVWKQQKKLYIQSVSPNIKLNSYLIRQLHQYYGIPPYIQPEYIFNNIHSFKQTTIVYTPYATDIAVFCKEYDLIIGAYNARCHDSDGLYLKQPFAHDYYRIRHIFDKDKLIIEHFTP